MDSITLVLKDRDAIQQLELLLRRQVGGTVTIVMKDGRRVTGNLTNVEAGLVTVRPLNGASQDFAFGELKEVHTEESETP